TPEFVAKPQEERMAQCWRRSYGRREYDVFDEGAPIEVRHADRFAEPFPPSVRSCVDQLITAANPLRSAKSGRDIDSNCLTSHLFAGHGPQHPYLTQSGKPRVIGLQPSWL